MFSISRIPNKYHNKIASLLQTNLDEIENYEKINFSLDLLNSLLPYILNIEALSIFQAIKRTINSHFRQIALKILGSFAKYSYSIVYHEELKRIAMENITHENYMIGSNSINILANIAIFSVGDIQPELVSGALILLDDLHSSNSNDSLKILIDLIVKSESYRQK
ncbi:MAG: hypothetical protein P1U74_07365 [Legionellaceae bacterium]|nr:hypothetical protein [Legionellaceae bacterium]